MHDCSAPDPYHKYSHVRWTDQNMLLHVTSTHHMELTIQSGFLIGFQVDINIIVIVIIIIITIIIIIIVILACLDARCESAQTSGLAV